MLFHVTTKETIWQEHVQFSTHELTLLLATMSAIATCQKQQNKQSEACEIAASNMSG